MGLSSFPHHLNIPRPPCWYCASMLVVVNSIFEGPVSVTLRGFLGGGQNYQTSWKQIIFVYRSLRTIFGQYV